VNNKQWFQPLSTVEHAEMGATDENMFDGPSLGKRDSGRPRDRASSVSLDRIQPAPALIQVNDSKS
jgi:hypothetical protein